MNVNDGFTLNIASAALPKLKNLHDVLEALHHDAGRLEEDGAAAALCFLGGGGQLDQARNRRGRDEQHPLGKAPGGLEPSAQPFGRLGDPFRRSLVASVVGGELDEPLADFLSHGLAPLLTVVHAGGVIVPLPLQLIVTSTMSPPSTPAPTGTESMMAATAQKRVASS